MIHSTKVSSSPMDLCHIVLTTRKTRFFATGIQSHAIKITTFRFPFHAASAIKYLDLFIKMASFQCAIHTSRKG